MRISIVLLTASGLLMGCGSKKTTSTTPSPRTGSVVVVSDKKPAKPNTNKPAHVTEKKAEKNEAKAEKKAEKAVNKAEKKSEKASEKSEKASQKSEKPSPKSAMAAEKSSEKASEKKAAEKSSEKSEKASGNANKGPRHVNVPPGHYPPEGMCRLWYEGRAPGQQPKPTECNKLKGKVPADAFVLYNGKYFDGGYDWSGKRNSIPERLIDILIASR